MRLEQPAPRPAKAQAGAAARDYVEYLEVVGDSYVTWRVAEVNARNVPGARRDRCLLFFGDGVIRRVWEYPSDWKTLDAKALARLSWKQ